VKPGTVEGDALAFDRAVSDLADPSWKVFDPALEVIIAGGGTASITAKTAAVSAIHSLMVDPIRLSMLDFTECKCWSALGSLGSAARQAVPMLRQRLEKLWSEGESEYVLFSSSREFTLLSCLAAVSPEDAVPALRKAIDKIWHEGWEGNIYCKRRTLLTLLAAISTEEALAFCGRSLEEGGKHSRQNEDAVHAACALGKAAIPTLEKFCGTFSGERGRLCKAAISALRNGEKTLSLR